MKKIILIVCGLFFFDSAYAQIQVWDCSTETSQCTASLDDDGNFVVSGKGAMKEYGGYASEVPWYSQMGKIKNVVIEDGITNVGLYAFAWANIDTVSLAPSVTAFSWGAFREATIGTLVAAAPRDVGQYWYPSSIQNLYCLGEISACESRFSPIASNIYDTVQKDRYGATYIYDKEGHFLSKYGVENPPKRIYTVEEAARLSKKTGNTFKIRYR
ncbi:MAG: hypothetical protein IJ870_02170 [Alphaproteobacteria bacterium]|nr:hypothetical protein [Alphaproteobacteria bacterium]